jgi:hypothetical protein
VKLCVAVQDIAKAIHKTLRPDGIMVAQFNGEAAGQTVYHFHFHVIPCWTGQPQKGHGHGQRADTAGLRKLAQAIAAGLGSPPARLADGEPAAERRAEIGPVDAVGGHNRQLIATILNAPPTRMSSSDGT